MEGGKGEVREERRVEERRGGERRGMGEDRRGGDWRRDERGGEWRRGGEEKYLSLSGSLSPYRALSLSCSL